jgi:hypothetical protein
MKLIKKLADDYALDCNTFTDSFATAAQGYKAGFEQAILMAMNKVANAHRLGFIRGEAATVIIAIENLLTEEE